MVDGDLKYGCSIYEGQPFAYCITVANYVHAEDPRCFSSKTCSRQENMSLFHVSMMEVLRPLQYAGSASSEEDGVGRDVWSCFSIGFPIAATYLKGKICRVKRAELQ